MSYIPILVGYFTGPDGETWYSNGSYSAPVPRDSSQPRFYSGTPPSHSTNYGSYGSPPSPQSRISSVAGVDSSIPYGSYSSSSSYPRDTQGNSGINQSFHMTNGPPRSYSSRNGGGMSKVTRRDSNRASSQISYAQQAYQESIPDATGDIADFSSTCIACGQKGADKPLPKLQYGNWEWTTNKWETHTISSSNCQRKICTVCLSGAGSMLNDACTDLPYVSGLNGLVQAKYRPHHKFRENVIRR
jgi:hypothetical protein